MSTKPQRSRAKAADKKAQKRKAQRASAATIAQDRRTRPPAVKGSADPKKNPANKTDQSEPKVASQASTAIVPHDPRFALQAATMMVDPSPTHEHLTDLGNAKRFVAWFGQDLRYCPAWKKWLVWDDRRWAVDTKGRVVRLAKQAIRVMYVWASKDHR